MHNVVECVKAVNVSECEHYDGAIFLNSCGKIFVMEEADMPKILGDGHVRFWRNAEQLARLSEMLLPCQ